MNKKIEAIRIWLLVSTCIVLLSTACTREVTPQAAEILPEKALKTEEPVPYAAEMTGGTDQGDPLAQVSVQGEESKREAHPSRLGQLVDIVSADEKLPTPSGEQAPQAEPNPNALVKISVGSDHACGIRIDQTLVCWGGNENGQSNPPDGNFTEVSSGNSHSCAINTDSGVECWGNNNYAAASPPTSTFLKIDGYKDTYCGVQTNHAISCWGYESDYGTWPAGRFQDLDIQGSYAGCAVDSSQKTVCWSHDQPYTIEGRYQNISVGEDKLACGVDQFNVVRCWDLNQGKEFMKLYGEYRDVSIGEDNWFCAVTLDDELSCSHGFPHLIPSQLEGVKIKLFEASPNQEVACVITMGGLPVCWGWDGIGITYSLWGTRVP